MADKAFGERLKRARQRAGYRTQGAFAKEMGVTRSTVGAWESGKQSPTRYIGLIEKFVGSLEDQQPRLHKVDAHTRRVIRAALPDDEDYRNVIGVLEGRLIVIAPDEDPAGSAPVSRQRSAAQPQ